MGDLLLWYGEPAHEWTQALPVGSGRLGAMVFGGPDLDRLQLNEDTLWGGGPYDPNHPDALAALPEVRRLVFEGKYREAHDLAEARMMARPLLQMPYQVLGHLEMAFPGMSAVERYRRELRLDTAVARTTFTCRGVAFQREIFASPVDQVIVVHLSADAPGRITFDLSMTTPQKATVEAKGDELTLRGTNRGAHGVESALRFEARVHVVRFGGSSRAEDGVVSVRDADHAILLVAAATSYKSFRDVSGDPGAIVTRQIAQAREKS